MGAAMKSAFTIAALYRFAAFDDPEAIARDLRLLCADLGACGTLIVAAEGINGTVAGNDRAIAALVAHIRTLPGCADLRSEEHTSELQSLMRISYAVFCLKKK